MTLGVASRPVTILHLSDIRFGAGHRLGRLRPHESDDSPTTLLSLFLEDLSTLVDEEGDLFKPDLLVVTGDLTNAGRPSELRDAQWFLANVARGLELPHERVVLLPGNHDISRDACAAYFSSCSAEEKVPVPPYWPKWRPWVAFFREFYKEQPAITFTESRPWTFFEIPELRVVVAGLNSTMAESQRDEDHHGFLGDAQLQWFARELEPYRQWGWLRIAALHHSARGGPTRDEERVADLEAFRTILGGQVNLVLQGHTHDGRTDWLVPHVPLLATGNAALGRKAVGDEALNQYQIIRVARGRLHRWARVYRRGQMKWANDPRVGTGGRGSEEVSFLDLGESVFQPAARLQGGTEDTTVSRRGSDFLAEVEAALRIRERPNAEIRRLREGWPPVEYLRVAVPEGGILRTYPVGVVDHQATRDDLEMFLDRVDARFRETDTGVISKLVYRGDREALGGLVRDAAARRVQLLSLAELQGMIDFRAYLDRQARRLENDPVYPPGLYVPQRMAYSDGDGEKETDDALKTVLHWLTTSPDGRFILALGDFGTGKTFFLRELARRLGGDRGGLIPILVEMRNLEKGRTLDQLLAQHFAQEGMEDFSPTRFRYMLRQGHIALLFDGFDELAVRVTYDKATEHFDALLQAAEGSAKVVVTSRRQHFESDQQIKSTMGEQVEQLAGRRIVNLLPFDRQQIFVYLANRCGDEEKALARYKLLDQVKDLLGLSQNARMLAFISELSDDQLRLASKGEGEISNAALYEMILTDWLGREYSRAHPKGVQPGLSPEQRWNAVTELALRLWEKIDHAVSLAELKEDVALVIEELSARQREQAAFQVGSGTLLVRDEEGNFSLIHQSVLEWLVARHAAVRLKEGGTPEVFAVREISELLADFFVALAGRQKAAAWARATLSGDARDAAKRNALLVLSRLGEEAEPQALNLAGQDLRGKDLSGQDMAAVDLARADLSAARLVGTRLANARLAGARLNGADLSRADLSGADLSGANLTGARLLGANLSAARLDGAVLHRAKLLGARWGDGALDALDHADTFGAALAVPQGSIEAEVAAALPCLAVAWSLDGEFLAAGEGQLVRLWDAASGRELRRYAGHGDRVQCVTFRPNGQALASGSADGTVRLWDLVTGREVHRLPGHGGGVTRIAFSGDGRALAVAGADDGSLKVWNVAAGAEVLRLTGHTGRAFAVCWSPDATTLASGGEDGTVRLWTPPGTEVHRLLGHQGRVGCVAWGPDGRTLASGGDDGTVRLWDTVAGRLLHVLEGHEKRVLEVAWSPDGKLLASASADKTVRLWQAADGRPADTLPPHEESVWSVAFAPNGHTLATGAGNDGVRLWDLDSGQPGRRLPGHKSSVWSLAWSLDGATLVTASEDRVVRLWSVGTGRERRRLPGPKTAVRCLASGPDGAGLAGGCADGSVLLWDLDTGLPTETLIGHEKPVRSVAFGPAGSGLLASGAEDNTLRIWSLADGRERRRCVGHRDDVRSVAWSPDGRLLASGSGDRTARVWDPASGKEVLRLPDHGSGVHSVAFGPGGRLLATGSADKTVRLWDATSGKEMLRFAGHGNTVHSVAWSPDGNLLASGSADTTVYLLDLVTGRELWRLTGHAAAVLTVAWSPDGQILASGAADNTVRLWDPATGTCAAVLGLLPEGWVAFTPDGRYKLGGTPAGSFWHVVGLCRFDPGELDTTLPGLHMKDGVPLLEAVPERAERD